jgi:hypothetical protein
MLHNAEEIAAIGITGTDKRFATIAPFFDSSFRIEKKITLQFLGGTAVALITMFNEGWTYLLLKKYNWTSARRAERRV